MFGCLFRFVRLIIVLILLIGIGGAAYYYTKVHPERAPWKDGAAVGKDRVSTLTLAAQVKAALALRESLKDLDIEVSAEKDVVTLRGKAPSADLSRTVEAVAGSVSGVRQVVNFLEIDTAATTRATGDERTMGERVDDEALELKVRAAFKLDRDLASAGFEVKAMRRAIRLSSSAATAEQKKHALEVARSVEGVAKAEVR